jgi:tetratricopeptide (TPR) repeat protein/tRNA A-37 threonylcarbamoyl transferase component Bud32
VEATPLDAREPAPTLGDDADTDPAVGVRSEILAPRDRDPTRIGRFVVLRMLGQGGMGRVYVGYDEQLDRRVAIKVLRPFRDVVEEAERARVLREAKAMAKLSHPNVVQVFEVGSHAGQLFVAMELVRGITLGEWQAVPGRRWTDVLHAYRQAGEGLVAAHAAGLVHRDFKPQNAMVDDDGGHVRVRVLDFGLARLRTDPTHDSLTDGRIPTSGSDPKLTATGSVLGTPAYMAPEQFSSASVDAAADQFSFCVSLWEGLYGSRPFRATSMHAMARAIVQGDRADPPRDSAVPTWVRAAVERGLAMSPSERWPSMRELVEALGRDPAVRRRAWIRRAAAVVLLGVGTAGAIAWVQADADRCTGAAAELAGAWDEARRAEIEAAILGTDLPYAADGWRVASEALDGYAQQWIEMHTDVCAATTIRGEQSAELMDLRMACLQRARRELQAATDVLADPDASVVQNAWLIVSELAPVSRCADVEALSTDAEPPSERDAPTVAAARELLADVEAETLAGRYRIAEERLDEAAAIVAEIDYAPVQIELALARASILAEDDRYADAEVELTRALELATQRLHRAQMQTAATKLLRVVGRQPQRTEEARQRYRLLAEALAEGDVPRQATVHHALADLLDHEGKYAEAEVEVRHALALREQLADTWPLGVAMERAELGAVLHELGRHREAEAEFRLAVQELERVLGPNHPAVAMTRANMIPTLGALGDYAGAEAEARVALAIREQAFGPDHADVASSVGDLAAIHYWQGDYAEAEALLRRSIAIEAELYGADHPGLAKSHNNLGLLLAAQDNFAEAEVEHRKALAIKEATLGRDHPDVASGRMNLAVLLSQQQRFAEAEAEQRAALLSLEASLPPEHPDLDRARVNLANILVDLGRHAEALVLAEDVWPRRQGKDVPPGSRAAASFVLARSLWEADRTRRDHARDLAEKALADYTAAGDGSSDEVATVNTWLAEHARE